MLRKITTLVLCALSSTMIFADEITLPSTNFNFDIKTVSSAPAYQPLTAFVNDGKTYIKFVPTVSSSNLPIILVDQLPGHPAPQIAYQDGYVVIDQPSSTIKIYHPKTKALIYQLQLSNHFDYNKVPPSPHLLPYEYAGFFVGANVGAANIDSKGYAAAFGGNIGYDWHFYKGFLAGFEFGGNYDGKQTKDQVTVKSWNINLMLRARYLFESGFNFVGKLGGAYVRNSATQNGTDVGGIGNGVAARAGASAGYLFTNGIGLNLEYDHVFSTSKVNSVNTVTMGISYTF
ncbi:outer membrane protein [Facilibium subflavum]|uniref:outer membrane protein n=1 Tax=Facilibium subflavum TaxID=2219058 RepID=UPI0013C376E7|nr:porin family protein [Facilibium subflavum]